MRKKNTSSGLNFQSLHDRNKKIALRKVKLCENLADKRNGPKKKGLSKQHRFCEELELRAALDDCRIWTFAVENFQARATAAHNRCSIDVPSRRRFCDDERFIQRRCGEAFVVSCRVGRIPRNNAQG